MADFNQLTRKQLDERLLRFRDSIIIEVPSGGWIKTIRKALGMSAGALGKRLGITQSAVSQHEASEQAESITLSTLRRIASGLECDLVYVVIPKESLNEIRRKQAIRRATSIVRSVSSSMELEDQGVSTTHQQSQIDILAQELLAGSNLGFWEEI